MKRVSHAQMEAYQSKVNTKIESMHRKLEVLVALEKRLALALVEVLPTVQTRTDEQIPGYNIVPIKSGRKTKWVWKHFLRNSRALKPFDTREECLRSAKRDALEQLAYGKPSRDIATILNSIEREPGRAQPQAELRGGRQPQAQRRVQELAAH